MRTPAQADIATQVGKLDYHLYRSLSLKMGDPRSLAGAGIVAQSDPQGFRILRLTTQAINSARQAISETIREEHP